MAKLSKIKGKVSETYKSPKKANNKIYLYRMVVERKLAGEARLYINKVKVDKSMKREACGN